MEEGEPSRLRAGGAGASLDPVGADPALDHGGEEPHSPILAGPASRGRQRACNFRGAYVFAAGHSPSDALCGPKCSGTVAENTIRAGNGPELESKFALCTRHSDLLWLLGYHGELRDGSLLHGAPSDPRVPENGAASRTL